MTLARPVREAENRLAGFNRERGLLVNEVEVRVLAQVAADAAKGGDHSVEYVLNDCAVNEIGRLERGPASAGEKKRLPEWRELSRRVGSMTQVERQEWLQALVHEYAGDICGSFDDRVYRFAKGMLPALIGGLLSPHSLLRGLAGFDLGAHVVVDGAHETVRACADRGTLVVVPTHSSNMDSVVFGWSLARAGLPPCTYGAGKNLFSNPFISFFMRNLGAYRVDRRLRHALYKDVLKTYATVLLEHGYHSLFFPGGTRSRSGAVERHLKLGLLGTAVAAYQRNLAAGAPHRRVYVVPATINYSLVLEAETLIDDFLAEEGKARYIIEDDEFSRLGRLLDFTRRVFAIEGAVVIRYGAPLDPFGNPVDENGESRDPHGRIVDTARYVTDGSGRVVADPQRDAEYTRGLGDELVRAFQRLTVLMPSHIVSRALYDRVAKIQRTRDVYRLLRMTDGAKVPASQVIEEIAAWQARLAADPSKGELHPRAKRMPPPDLLDEALRTFQGYHTRPVAERAGEDVRVRDLRLVYYYANRTAHMGSLGGAA